MSVIYRNGQKYAGMNLGAYQKKESEYVTQSGTTTTVPIGIDGYRSTDILLVDVNGLNLVEDTDYTVSGTNIVLVTPITKAGESIHFVSLRTGSVESVDLSSLKGDKGDKGDAGVVDAYPRTGATPLSANWLSETSGGSALTPESDQIYILMADSGDYTANSMFRWNGSAYEPLTSGGSGGGGHVELTQAEYDALTQEEKENGEVYFITDGVPEYTIINDSVPIGAIQSYGGVSLPYGWLFCDGAAVSRETYSELFTAIGTTYGSGDGSTTFNLPDLRGRVITGVGTADGVSYTLGSKVDAGVPNITGAAQHDPTYSGTNLSSNYLSGAFVAATASKQNYLGTFNSGGGWCDLGFDASKSNSHYGKSTTVQPNTTVCNYIIKALNTVSSSRLEELDPQQILFNMFYPVGSYYETSDATFDPNVQWRGTWVLKDEETNPEDKKLLWTNPNDKVNFSEQTISLDLSNYDAVEIEVKAIVTSPTYDGITYPVLRFAKGTNSVGGSFMIAPVPSNSATVGASEYSTFRSIIVLNNMIKFGSGGFYRWVTLSASDILRGDNRYCVPVKIYGIKQNIRYSWHRTA